MTDLDLQLALDLRDVAIEAAEVAAAPDWKEEAIAAVQRVCRKLHEFTVDDVVLEMNGCGASTHEMRALGPVMLQCARNGWMQSTRRVVKSAQPQCHGNLRTLWRSKL